MRSEKERKGRAVISWTLPADAPPPAPLPCRQELEKEYPEALAPLADLEAAHAAYVDNLNNTPAAAKQRDAIAAVPVVLVSQCARAGPAARDARIYPTLPTLCVFGGFPRSCWEASDHADPHGTTLRKVAAMLAAQMPTYSTWDVPDVGVFFDWCSIFQVSRRLPMRLAARRHSSVSERPITGRPTALVSV